MSDPRSPVDEMQKLAAEVRKINDRIDRLATPGGSSLARAVARLAALQTVSVTSGSVSHTGPGNTDFTSPPSLALSLPFDSVVTVEIDIPYEGQTATNSTAQLNAEYSMGFGGNQLNLFEQIGGASNVSFSFNGSRTRTMFYLAGEYTISPVVARVGLTGGTPGVHFINGGPIRLTATVLGTS